jgi:hypothetical protein
MLTAIVYLDRIEPGRAAEASQRALARMPFLKSANQVADNQRGIANAAYPLAYMGLEAWSRSAAQESYLPYWGGSHLFLADRYPGSFNRRSELMLGFLTDPLVFGASNRYQSLFITPGHHGTLSMGFNTSEQLRVLDPVVTLNGHSAGPLPMSYFVEASDARVDPRDLPFEARQRSFTVAVGAKPTHELGVFVYAAYVNSDFEVGQELSTRQFERVSAESARVDAGIRYAPDARSSYWAKAGGGTTKRSTDFAFNFVIPGLSLVQNVSQEPKRDEADVALRHTRDIGKALQLTLGAEAAWLRNPLRLVADTVVHVPGQGVNQERDLFGVRDKTQSLYGSARARFGPLQAEAGMTYAEYHADRDLLVSRDAFPGQDIYLTGTFRRRKGDPMAGLAWHASEHVIARAMCRRWVRPLSIDTLAPLAVAGIAIEDQLVLRGGELEQCRLHGEVRLGSRAFAFAFADHVKVRNIVSGVQGISNVGEEATNVERLRNRVLSPPLRPDQLEDEPVFGSGTARRAGIALEALVTQNLGARLHYTYIDSHNDDPTASYLRLPYMPRHQVHVGATWTPGWRTVVTAQAVYRTRRFTDENNTVSLPASWDAYVRLFWESPRKRWGLELTAANLIKKETPDLFGIVVSYRF